MIRFSRRSSLTLKPLRPSKFLFFLDSVSATTPSSLRFLSMSTYFVFSSLPPSLFISYFQTESRKDRKMKTKTIRKSASQSDGSEEELSRSLSPPTPTTPTGRTLSPRAFPFSDSEDEGGLESDKYSFSLCFGFGKDVIDGN